jgi:hypothetical protein
MSVEHLLPPLDGGQPEVIVSAALYLMSSYSCRGGCPRLAHVIVKHLRVLAEREDLAPVLRETCGKLVEQWEVMLHDMLPATPPPPADARIFRFRRKLH